MESVVFFNQINDVDVEWMSAHSYRQQLKKGEGFDISRDEPSLAVILSGTVFTVDKGNIVFLGKGDILGDKSFLDDEAECQEYHANETSTILVINSDALSSRLKSDALFSSRLFRALAGLLASTMIKRMYAEKEEINDADLTELRMAGNKFRKLCNNL